MFNLVSTITAIMEADADGSLHLPVPAEMKHQKIKVTATLTVLSDVDEAAKRSEATAALERIAARGGLEGIEDPVSWQQQVRGDRPLPGRNEE